MSEPTFQGDVSARGDWSQVYTNLDWVARWMADHGYTDTEIAYVVDRPLAAVVATEVAPAPVELTVDASPAPAAVETVDAVETVESVWTIPLAFAAPDASEEDAPVGSDETDEPDETDETESAESFSA